MEGKVTAPTLKMLLPGNRWAPASSSLGIISQLPLQHAELMRLITGNEFSWQLNPILPASLFSIKEPFPGMQTALLQTWVVEIKINASKAAVPFILSGMAPRGFQRTPAWKGSCMFCLFPQRWMLKHFSSKLVFRFVKRKWYVDFESLPSYYLCSSTCCTTQRGLGDTAEATGR